MLKLFGQLVRIALLYWQENMQGLAAFMHVSIERSHHANPSQSLQIEDFMLTCSFLLSCLPCSLER